MKRLISRFLQTFFRKELELQVKIFHILAIAGVLICVSTTILSLVQNMMVSVAINAGTGVVSLLLPIYSARGGKQQVCYMATVVFIFLILFPSLFLFGGGYTGGMGFSFVFAVVYTVYMLSGWKMVAVTVFELIYYSGLCVYAWLYPERIVPFATELDVLIDVIIAFVAVSVALGATMFAQFQLYQQQQKELETARAQAEVANRAKSTFLANMSHEIRTPIHVIMSINELIRSQATDRKIREYGDKIQDAGEVLRSLVDHILDMSKIEAGKTELQLAPYSTYDLMRVLELTGQTRCQARGLKFHCAKRDLPPYLYGDMDHVRQIVINLLSNGAKYTQRGSVTLSVSCKPGTGADDLILCFSVSDTGVGIAPDALEMLFEPFTRSEQPRYVEGSGLGLSIVKELCRLMDGSIRVESRKGWGSTFTVELPQKRVDRLEEPGLQTMTFLAPQGRVLVVDDNRENLSVMVELLGRTKLQVDTCSSGKEALKAARSKEYHVVLLDYMMPDMDGVETVRALKAIPGFSAPVIGLTANAVAGTRELLLQAGFTEYLTKPIARSRLEQLLMHCLPRELVTQVPVAGVPSQASQDFLRQYQSMVEPFQVDLAAALDYFDGDPQACLQTVALFLSHSLQTRHQLETLARDQENMVYAVHTLKGKAKNLGLTALFQEAWHLEQLCRENREKEARSLLPHLLYLYDRALEGLRLLQPVEPTGGGDSVQRSPEELRQTLPELLGELRRGPALECIRGLLEQESREDCRVILEELDQAVRNIDFDRALILWEQYKKEES